MQRTLKLICLITAIALLISSCSSASVDRGSTNTPVEMKPNTIILPDGFTTDNIKKAIEEYINSRLWIAPDRVYGTYEDKSFEPYINQSIEIEVRLYTDDNGQKKVYADTSISDWLIVFNLKEGLVYGDGQVSEGDTNWPVGKFDVVTQYTLLVNEPHKPNYGASSRKDQMIAAAETYLNFLLCEDFIIGEGGEKWIGATAYLADFYEYEDTAGAWIVRQDGYIWSSPIGFTNYNVEIGAQGVKGFGIDNLSAFDKNDIVRFTYEQQIKEAVRHFVCE